MTEKSLHLTILPPALAVCRLPSGSPLPAWCMAGEIWSVTRTASELSIVCSESAVPAPESAEAAPELRVEGGWRAFEVAGPLDFGLTGILAGLTAPLAEAGISIFALSTFDTDYLLVRGERLEEAARVLEEAGNVIKREVS